jgi:putative transposase
MKEKGWHNRGYIPHFDGAGLVQHIVLRTANSLPSEMLKLVATEDIDKRRSRIDRALDQSQTGKIFNDVACANVMVHGLRHFCGTRYDLLAWCVMPNHIHIVVLIYPDHNLGQVVRSWKTFVTSEINRLQKSSGPIFAKDYFDRFMRDGIQTERAIAYVENNPVAAGLCIEPQNWAWSSAFERAKGWEPNVENLPLWLPN